MPSTGRWFAASPRRAARDGARFRSARRAHATARWPPAGSPNALPRGGQRPRLEPDPDRGAVPPACCTPTAGLAAIPAGSIANATFWRWKAGFPFRLMRSGGEGVEHRPDERLDSPRGARNPRDRGQRSPGRPAPGGRVHEDEGRETSAARVDGRDLEPVRVMSRPLRPRPARTGRRPRPSRRRPRDRRRRRPQAGPHRQLLLGLRLAHAVRDRRAARTAGSPSTRRQLVGPARGRGGPSPPATTTRPPR